ncbi:hypothetical protein FC83_GL001690 [Agrilactobacillus composti DSM 18527 = JCM 14202]|uniref:Uncharacterized protein n=2 Tax=Agrilactobacillus TaxID=2767875 RepID=A0A0R1XRB2_9LACO|nr:AEC family transporter [Agrilactobacillus composti]KRM30555.1 hypothetical protein FC83_GL001690 [Agrilactobacillus composti DSM 18527 = JCM 14202]
MLPVLLIFLTGFIFQRVFMLDIRPLSTMAMYLLLPFLVFQTFYKQPLDASFLYIVVTSLLILAGLILIGWLLSKWRHYPKKQVNGFLLATVFPNSGNYGVPIVLFAYGQKGLAYAMPLMVFHTILMGVVGIYIAANGDSAGGFKKPLQSVLKQPMNYVIIPGILMQHYHVTIPANFMKSIDLVSNIAIPLIMLILGMQLANVVGQHINWRRVGLASILRLVISPILAYAICLMFPIDPLLRNVIVVMAAMPSAANTTLYAIEFEAEPQFVSSATLVTTLASIFSLTFVLNLL